METIKLEVSKLTAKCLQRMIYKEIENQKEWFLYEETLGLSERSAPRDIIIAEMEELTTSIEKQGIHKYIKCQ